MVQIFNNFYELFGNYLLMKSIFWTNNHVCFVYVCSYLKKICMLMTGKLIKNCSNKKLACLKEFLNKKFLRQTQVTNHVRRVLTLFQLNHYFDNFCTYLGYFEIRLSAFKQIYSNSRTNNIVFSINICLCQIFSKNIIN